MNHQKPVMLCFQHGVANIQLGGLFKVVLQAVRLYLLILSNSFYSFSKGQNRQVLF
jgi:hypothetical protein